MVFITVTPKGVKIQLCGLDGREERQAALLFARISPAVDELRRLVGGRRKEREPVMMGTLEALR